MITSRKCNYVQLNKYYMCNYLYYQNYCKHPNFILYVYFETMRRPTEKGNNKKGKAMNRKIMFSLCLAVREREKRFI